jgi:hypothetical protein
MSTGKVREARSKFERWQDTQLRLVYEGAPAQSSGGSDSFLELVKGDIRTKTERADNTAAPVLSPPQPVHQNAVAAGPSKQPVPMSSFSDLKPNEDPAVYVGRMQAEKEAMRVRADEARVRASDRGSDASTGKKTEKGENGKEANGEEEKRRRDTRFYTFYDELLEEWTYR